MSTKKPTVGHLHPQNGSWPIAAELAGMDNIWFYENNGRVLRTLRKNYPKIPVFLSSRSLLQGRITIPDFIGGSPPCAGMSQANPKAQLNDPRNRETVLFAEIVEKFKPRAFMMEMVPTFYSTPKYKPLYDEFKSHLKEYKVTEDLIDFSMYGAPQKRRRYVILGGRNEAITFPSASQLISINEAWEGLPDLDEENAGKKALLLGSIDEFEGEEEEAPTKQLKKRGPKPKDKDESFKNSLEERQVKLEGDWICPTMTSTAGKQFLHPKYNRTCTFRELARLMEFPDSFEFAGSTTAQFRLLCEGVPCKALSLFLKEATTSMIEGKN